MTVLRDLHTLDEFRQVMELEIAIWGYTDYSDVVTLPMFIITVKRGAILIGAFDETNRMVGFVYSIVGLKDQRAIQWSHMAGVLPEYRGRGLGRELKLAQRQRALEAGFDLIEWTFDPLQATNAHLNFVKLGVVCDEYAVNIYGDSSSTLHRGTPTDRFVVQWNIREPHVDRRVAGDASIRVGAAEAVQAPVANAQGVDLPPDAERVWVEIPTGFTELQQTNPEAALKWRMDTRQIFQHYFGRGYRAVDFELQVDKARGRYLLARV